VLHYHHCIQQKGKKGRDREFEGNANVDDDNSVVEDFGGRSSPSNGEWSGWCALKLSLVLAHKNN